MTPAALGLVLAAMAKEANRRADYHASRRYYRDDHVQTSIMLSVQQVLKAGVEECLRQAEEN